MADTKLSETAVYSGFLISAYSSATYRSIPGGPVQSQNSGKMQLHVDRIHAGVYYVRIHSEILGNKV